MADDFLLQAGVKLDLSSLNAALSQAVQQTQVAGQKMQQALSFAPTGMGPSPFPTSGNFGAFNPGKNVVSFGNGFNAATGSKFSAPSSAPFGGFATSSPLPAGPGYRPPVAPGMMSKIGGFMAEHGIGQAFTGAYGPLAAAAAVVGAAHTGASLLSNGGNALGSYSNVFGAAGRGDLAGTYRSIANFENAYAQLPFGGIAQQANAGVRSLLRVANANGIGDAPVFRQLNKFIGDTDYQATAGVADEYTSTRRQNLGYGGFRGKQRQLAFDTQQLTFQEGSMRAAGVDDNVLKLWKKEKQTQLGLQSAELITNRATEIYGLGAEGRQSSLRMMGLGKFADLEGLKASAGKAITESAADPTKQNLLIRNYRKQRMAMMLGDISPAQSISSTELATAGSDAVRTGSLAGQSDAYLAQIARNTGIRPTPVIGRN